MQRVAKANSAARLVEFHRKVRCYSIASVSLGSPRSNTGAMTLHAPLFSQNCTHPTVVIDINAHQNPSHIPEMNERGKCP